MPQPPIGRRPLSGIRVIDFSMFVAGPHCTRSLADLGADVLKVEPPEGDNLRTAAPFREGCSAYFGQLNAGKRSVTLNLKQPEAVAAAIDLIKGADVVVENGRPGTMNRLGLGYDKLSAINPRIVFCSISGFGQTGPGANRPAYAQTVQALSGYDLALTGYQDNQDRPPNTGIFPADILASVYAFSGIMTALYDRERTGKGQFVDLAMMDCMLNLLPYEVQEAQFPAVKRRPVFKPMRTTDGYVMVALVAPRNFYRLFETMGHEEWQRDPRFSTVAARSANWDELMSSIEEWTSQMDTEQCMKQLAAAEVPSSKYQTIQEAMRDPQLAARGSMAQVVDAAGPFLIPNLPFKLSNADTEASGASPRLGEHNSDVFGPAA
ncbi:CoA transferase [soil metagenome]